MNQVTNKTTTIHVLFTSATGKNLVNGGNQFLDILGTADYRKPLYE